MGVEEFLVVDFTIQPAEPGRDVLVALLDNLGYDSFEETGRGLKAYIPEAKFDEKALQELSVVQSRDFKTDYQVEKLETKNWNEEWETHYQPVWIDDEVYIHASFHPEEKEVRYPITITPKMSFGTGHHQTTRVMARMMLELNWKGKEVLDMGTGTGVLAILAEKMGAGHITAIDNFEWAVENTEENAHKNHCRAIKAEAGDAALLEGRSFDAILANINRNVLLQDMKTYARALHKGGPLLLSGYFEDDQEKIDHEARKHDLRLVKLKTEAQWVCSYYQKN